MILSEHIKEIEFICLEFGWKTNRIRQFNRALRMYRERSRIINTELIKNNINPIN
jgi:hypothetical protein